MKHLPDIATRFFYSSLLRILKLSGIKKLCVFIFLLIVVSSCFRESIMDKVEEYNRYLEIVSVSPAGNAADVSLTSAITVEFNSDIDMSTVSSSVFSVNGGTVTGVFSYNPLLRTVLFTPDAELYYNTLYTVNVTKGIRNLDGNFLASAYAWSFTTVKYFFNVLSFYPPAGAGGVSVNTDIIAEFSDNIDLSTVSTSTFRVDGGVGAVPGAFVIDPLLRIVTFTPAGDLNPFALHTVTLTTGIKNITGDSMVSDYSWSFTTGSALQPEIYMLSPLGEILTGELYDFGSAINPATVTAGFTIMNTGTATLNITGVSITGPNSLEFSNTAIPATIGAGGNAAFTVTFMPDATPGVKNGVLTITNDDSDESAFVINLTGLAPAVPAPEIQITNGGTILVSGVTVVDFGTVPAGSTGTIVLVMHNIGSADLVVSGYSIAGNNPEFFSTDFAPLPSTITAGTTKTFNIYFSPTGNGNKKADIIFQNNDSDESAFMIKVKGRGN